MTSRSMHLLYAVLLGLIPIIVTIGMLRVLYQTDLYQHVPTLSDEIIYWRETQTFMVAGFDGGYYTWNELPARAAFTRFYAHGPAFAVLTGLLANITGWYFYSLPFFNLVLLFLAIIAFTYLAQLDQKQHIFLALTLLTFWPILLYTSLTMQESFNQAIAILLAGFFSVRFFSASPPRWLPFAILATLFLGALIRPTWSLVAIILFLTPLEGKTARQLLFGLGKTVIFCAAMFGVATYWNSPYPNVAARFFTALSVSLSDGIKVLTHNMFRNLYITTQGKWLEVLQRIQIISLLVLILMARSRTKRFMRVRPWVSQKIQFTNTEVVFHLFNIGLMFAFNTVMYDFFAWRDYRVLAPHLLLSLLMLIANRRYHLMLVIIVSNLLLLPAFITTHIEINQISYAQDSTQLDRITDEIEEHIPVSSSGDTGWCRTVLAQYVPVETMLFPPDMGLSFFVHPDTVTPPIRSKYLLVKADSIAKLTGDVPFETLTTFGDLTLLYNPQSGCD